MLYTRRENLTKRPIRIPDKEMGIFMLVSSSGEQGLEYFSDDICRIKGNHRLIVAIQGVCAVATSYIPQCFLQKI